MEKKKSILSYILLVIAIIVVVNILSDRFFARFDFTEDKRFTLSKATENILDELDEPITITAYFTEEGLPPNILKVRRDFKEMLIEFGNLSHGNVVYEFI
ncbi:MAG: Gldg family protein, partial [Bacteroidota bacterium]|nr:Gldg family protein [Bacteroidota bacterium]